MIRNPFTNPDPAVYFKTQGNIGDPYFHFIFKDIMILTDWITRLNEGDLLKIIRIQNDDDFNLLDHPDSCDREEIL